MNNHIFLLLACCSLANYSRGSKQVNLYNQQVVFNRPFKICITACSLILLGAIIFYVRSSWGFQLSSWKEREKLDGVAPLMPNPPPTSSSSISMFILPPPTWFLTHPTFDQCTLCSKNVWRVRTVQCLMFSMKGTCAHSGAVRTYSVQCAVCSAVCSDLPVTG